MLDSPSCSPWRAGYSQVFSGEHSMRRNVFEFGKHRGKQTSQVDDGYLGWIVITFSESHSWWKTAADALTRNRKMKGQQSAKRNLHLHDLLSDLKSCTKKRDLQKGRQLHTDAVKTGLDSNMYVAASLINMYAKCCSMIDARIVFDRIQKPNVVSWTALILGYADNGEGLVALDLFSRMKDECDFAPNSVTYVAVLKACTSLALDGNESGKRRYLERGRELHSEIGCHMNHFVQNTLVDMYAKCGCMEDARTVFDSIQEPDVVSWNALILGYAEGGQGLIALDLFSRMKDERRCAPDSVTYIAVLKACASLGSNVDESEKRVFLDLGKEIHSEIGCHMNNFVENTLIDMYSKCGSMEYARSVFDGIHEPNVVSWNALILGYAEDGQGFVALDLFSRMNHEARCAPDSVTYIAVLKACTTLGAHGNETQKILCLERGRAVHSLIGHNMNHYLRNTLTDMYAKCGSMQDARAVFGSNWELDVVSWTALIRGYTDNGQGLVALDLFSRMKDKCRCAPNSITYVAAIKACCSIGALSIGRRIHSEIHEFNAHVVTCLVDLYAKCGLVEEARSVFDLHPRARYVSTWSALLGGYGSFGDTDTVFRLFEAMHDQGFQPNSVTFLCLLVCCSHAGLVQKAWEFLDVMQAQYGITPSVMHYTCMVDLLGRANKLQEAVALIQQMPCDPNVVTWTTLLGACRKWKNADIGMLAFESLVALDQKNASAYVLMADIYKHVGAAREDRAKFVADKQRMAPRT